VFPSTLKVFSLVRRVSLSRFDPAVAIYEVCFLYPISITRLPGRVARGGSIYRVVSSDLL